MDVQLPSGATITDVPEGTTKRQLMWKIRHTHPQDYQAYIAQQGQSMDRTAAQDVGALEAGLIGAGRTFTSLGRGIADLTGLGDSEAIAAAERAEAPGYQQLKQERPVSTFVGEVAPYALAATIPGGSVAGQTALGGTVGGAMYAPDMQARLINAGLGAAGGAAGTAVGNKLGAFLGSRAAGSLDDLLAESAERIGIRLTPGQATGSRGAKIMDASLESMPGSAGVMGAVADANQSAINRVASRAIGMGDVDELTPQVIGRAQDQISKMYDDALRDATLTLDTDFVVQARNILDTYVDLPGAKLSNKLKGAVGDTLEALKTGITGNNYNRFASRFRELGQKAAKKGDKALSDVYFGLREALDDLAERNAVDAGAVKNARQLYRNWLAVSDSIAKGGQNLSPAKLANALAKYDRWGFSGGRNTSDLYQIPRIWQAFKPAFGSSGTAERSWLANTLRDSLTFGVGGGAIAGPPGFAAALAPWLQPAIAGPVAKAYMSPRTLPPAVAQGAEAILPRLGAAAGYGASKP